MIIISFIIIIIIIITTIINNYLKTLSGSGTIVEMSIYRELSEFLLNEYRRWWLWNGKQEMLRGGSNKANIKTQGFEMKSKM